MRGLFLNIAALLDRITRAACMVAVLMLVAAVLTIVVLRYGFGVGYIGLQDFANYAFAILLALSVPVCLAQGGHVRVEVISERMGPSYLRIADAVSLILFLIPAFGLLIWAYWPELRYAWQIREASIETGGLPGLYLVKTTLPIAAGLTIVQGIAAVLRGEPGEGASS